MRILIVLLLMFLLYGCASRAGFSGGDEPGKYTSLDEMTAEMAKKVSAKFSVRKLAIDHKDIWNRQDKALLPFSTELASSLERSFGKAGWKLQEMKSDVYAFQVEALYSQSGDAVTVDVRFKREGESHVYSGALPLSALSRDAFYESADAKIARLAENLANNWKRDGNQILLAQPLVMKDTRVASDFSRDAGHKLAETLIKQNNITLKQRQGSPRGTRVFNPALPLEVSDAVYIGADAMLSGTVRVVGESVIISASIETSGGVTVAAESMTIPRHLILLSLTGENAEKSALYADVEGEKSEGMVRLSTTIGGVYQVFYAGEIYTLTAQVKTPLYLHLYDFFPDGDATRYLPQPGEPDVLRRPGVNHIIPDETAGNEKGIRVTAPFGVDTIKLFASDKPLRIPMLDKNLPSRSFINGTRDGVARIKVQGELAGRSTINPADLVDYYRGVAAKSGAKLYETTVFVETRPGADKQK